MGDHLGEDKLIESLLAGFIPEADSETRVYCRTTKDRPT